MLAVAFKLSANVIARVGDKGIGEGTLLPRSNESFGSN